MRISNDQGELYCTRCERWQESQAFAVDRRAKSGRTSHCKKCIAAVRRHRRVKHKVNELRQMAERKKLQPIF